MRQPKDYPMGRSAQIRYARNAVAVVVLIAVLLYSGCELATTYLSAATPK